MKVVITNTATLNTGDAAILIATVEILRQAVGPELGVVIHDHQPEDARRYYPYFDFHPLLFDLLGEDNGKWGRKLSMLKVLLAAALWRSPFRRLARGLVSEPVCASLDRLAAADLIMSGGGTYLVPHYRIFPKLFELLVASALRRPYVLFTQSLGPFHGHSRGWLLRGVLKRARAILVRDSRSFHHLTEFGVPADRVVACADAVFALSPENSVFAGNGPIPRRVAISVREWPYFPTNREDGMASYREAVAALTRHIVERYGAEVTFLSTCQGMGEYWTDDSRVAKSIAAHLPEDVRSHVEVDSGFHSPRVLLDRYREFDLVVATRMHAAILSLCAGVPVMPVAYEFKTTELFSSLGLGEFVQQIDTITGERLCRSFDRFVTERPAIQTTLAERIAEARRSALSAGRYVTGALTGGTA